MSLKDDINSSIDQIVSASWNERDGTVVPDSDDVALTNGAVWLDAVVLYADLFDSTGLVSKISQKLAARVIRAYLSTMSRLINAWDGSVRSFDGDRVMGVFVGGSKNSNAGKCALRMNYAVQKVIRPKFESKFAAFKEKGFQIEHCVGVDSGKLMVVRAGVRGSNDLVLVGRSANFAAKLSDIRNRPWHTYVTPAVYKRFDDGAKYSNGKDMWVATSRKMDGASEDLYKTNYRWAI